MDAYRDYGAPTIGELIGQMAIEMERKAEECQMLRGELAKKDSLLDQASRRIDALDEECRSIRRDLETAKEERARIAQILGLTGDAGNAFPTYAEKVPAHAKDPVAHRPEPVRSTETDLLEYATSTLARMRQLNSGYQAN